MIVMWMVRAITTHVQGHQVDDMLQSNLPVRNFSSHSKHWASLTKQKIVPTDPISTKR